MSIFAEAQAYKDKEAVFLPVWQKFQKSLKWMEAHHPGEMADDKYAEFKKLETELDNLWNKFSDKEKIRFNSTYA